MMKTKQLTSYLTLAFVKRPHCSPYLVSSPTTSSRHSPCPHWWYPSRIPAPLREQGRSHHTAVTSHDGDISCRCSPLCELPQQPCIDVYKKKISEGCHWDHLNMNEITLYSCKSDYQIVTSQVVSCVVGLRYGSLSEFLQRILILHGLCRFCHTGGLLGIRSQTILSSSFWKRGFPKRLKGNRPMRLQKVDSTSANYPTSSLVSVVLVFPSPCRATVSARYFQRSISCHGKAPSITKY